MLPKKSKEKSGELLNQHCSLLNVEKTQRGQTAVERKRPSQVSNSKLLSLIRYIIRKSMGAAFDRLQLQLDA